MTKTFYSHGKLLLTAEYLVLDGATALAVPTKKGQSLTVTDTHTSVIHWKSVLEDGSTWIDIVITLPLDEDFTSNDKIAQRLYDILLAAQELNPKFLSEDYGYDITSALEFPQDWGLGSSSTLIANISQWADIDPYKLLEKTFGGSGYDIACASAETAITYSNKTTPVTIRNVDFHPSFTKNLFFIHLNRKQNSRDSIQHYRNLDPESLKQEVIYFSKLTAALLKCDTLDTFRTILNDHEERLSTVLKTPTIKSQLFPEYSDTIKSLGGWGGDFVLVVCDTGDLSYFKGKGYHTIIPYDAMIL